jgi:PAS domain S-box-containing protein
MTATGVTDTSAGRTGWEPLFRLVFERSSHPIVLLDDDRRILDANAAAATLWGGSRSELVGRSMVDSIEPSERQVATREWQAFLRSGDYSGSRELVRADGTRVQVAFAARLALIGGRRVAVYVATSKDDHELEGGHLQAELPLTSREREVVTLIALGHDTKEIAADLHISPETVRSHVRNAMSKLDVHTRAQLVAVTLCAEQVLHEDCLPDASKIPHVRD